MLPSLLQFLISAAIIIAAGSVLTQFGDIISHRTKLGGLLVGTILIAGATAPPELAVDVNAVRMGAPDLAVGDLMGSSLFNLLILAVLDLTRYTHGRMLSETSARHALAATVSIALTGHRRNFHPARRQTRFADFPPHRPRQRRARRRVCARHPSDFQHPREQ
jgi:cation:H+ antiporter